MDGWLAGRAKYLASQCLKDGRLTTPSSTCELQGRATITCRVPSVCFPCYFLLLYSQSLSLMMVRSEKTSNSYNHHNSSNEMRDPPVQQVGSSSSSQGGKREEEKNKKKTLKESNRREKLSNEKNKWPRRGSIHLSRVNDEATWWITFVLKIKSQKKKKKTKVYTAPSCGVYISATMKYHCLFLLLSLFDFDSIHILSLGGSSSGSPPPHSPGLVYPFCMDSNCYPCDLTKVKHKNPPSVFLLPPDLNGCCTYITCRHTCIYIHVRLPFIEKNSLPLAHSIDI